MPFPHKRQLVLCYREPIPNRISLEILEIISASLMNDINRLQGLLCDQTRIL